MVTDDSAPARPDHPTDDARSETGADDGPLEAVVETVRHGIDQVADKVKGLLRSNR